MSKIIRIESCVDRPHFYLKQDKSKCEELPNTQIINFHEEKFPKNCPLPEIDKNDAMLAEMRWVAFYKGYAVHYKEFKKKYKTFYEVIFSEIEGKILIRTYGGDRTEVVTEAYQQVKEMF